MKFAGIAAALEALNKALENSQTLEIKIVITKDEYQKLKALGGDDDREAVRKAIMASIGANQKSAPKGAKAPDADKKIKTAIKCPSCQSPIKISTDERPIVIECSSCGVSGRLTAQNKWTKLES